MKSESKKQKEKRMIEQSKTKGRKDVYDIVYNNYRFDAIPRTATNSQITAEKLNPFLILAHFPSHARRGNLIASVVQSQKTFRRSASAEETESGRRPGCCVCEREREREKGKVGKGDSVGKYQSTVK